MTRAIAVLALALAACSASPPAPVDTCGPLTAPVPVCAPAYVPLDMASRVWGAYLDCDDPAAIQVVVEPIEGLVGQAYVLEGWLALDPAANSPQVVLAHEIGHMLGRDHAPGVCDLMSPTTSPRACGTVAIEGCEYRIKSEDP